MDGGDKAILWMKWVFLCSIGWFVGFIIGRWIGGYIGIAIAQWIVLRQLPNASWWLGLSVLGAIVGWFVSQFIIGILSLGMGYEFLLIANMMEGALFGFVFGLAQWFYLRRIVNQAGLWIVASITGWALGPFLSLSVFWHGIIATFVTSMALIWLMGHPHPDVDLSEVVEEIPA